MGCNNIDTTYIKQQVFVQQHEYDDAFAMHSAVSEILVCHTMCDTGRIAHINLMLSYLYENVCI